MKQLSIFVNRLNHPASWSLMDQAVISGGNFLLSLLLARQMGLENFGLFTLWYMFPLIVLSISQAIIVQPFQAFWSTFSEKEKASYASFLWLFQLCLSGIVLLASFLWGWACSSTLPIVAGVLAVLQSAYDFLRKYSYASGKNWLPLLISAPLYLIILSDIVFGAPDSVSEAFLLISLPYFLGVAVAAMILGFGQRNPRPWGGLRYIKKHYHYSFWLLGAALVQWLSGNVFLLAAAAILGNSALGGLRLAQQIVGITHVVFLAMENRIPVAASHHFHRGSYSGLYRYLTSVTSRYGLLVFLLLVALQFVSSLLEWGYAPEIVQEVMLYLPVYSCFYVLVFMAIPLRIALRSIQETAPIFWSYVITAALSCSLATLFVRQWGWQGVFAGLFLTQVISLAVYYLRLRTAPMTGSFLKSIT